MLMMYFGERLLLDEPFVQCGDVIFDLADLVAARIRVEVVFFRLHDLDPCHDIFSA